MFNMALGPLKSETTASNIVAILGPDLRWGELSICGECKIDRKCFESWKGNSVNYLSCRSLVHQGMASE